MTQSDGKEPSKILVLAAFAAIYLIWGSTYIGMLLAIKSIPPLLMNGMRFGTAGLILFTYVSLRREPLPDTRSITKISFSGVLMLFFGTGTVAWVEQYIPTGLAAIIVATVPLWFVLLDKRQWKFNFTNKWIVLGLLIGFVGIIVLFADGKSFNFSGNKMKLISLFVLLGGTVCWATGSLFSKYQKVNGSTVMKASIQMLAAGLTFFIVSLASGEFWKIQWSEVYTSSILAVCYLVLIGSLIGYMSYIWLLSVRPAALVGTYAYVNPVVAVFLGWLIVDEHIVSRQVIGLAIILFGVVLVNFAERSNR